MENKVFYTKLLAKLQKIKNGEMTLDFYINEVTEKLRLPHDVMLCTRCKGSMYMAGYPGQKVPCPKCNGTGINTAYKSVCAHNGDRFNPQPGQVVCGQCLERLE